MLIDSKVQACQRVLAAAPDDYATHYNRYSKDYYAWHEGKLYFYDTKFAKRWVGVAVYGGNGFYVTKLVPLQKLRDYIKECKDGEKERA